MMTEDEKAALTRTAPRLLKTWGVGDADAARLLRLPDAEWKAIKSGNDDCQLTDDQLQLVGALVGTHGALKIIFAGEADRVSSWVHAANSGPIMQGRTPIEVLIEGGLPEAMRIRSYLEAEVAG
ncbi:hypothetical protein ACGYLI_16760 [Sulfitobacter sp. 1A13421]|uniref:hypothetical protein n=1 Tax=Sulfitobacter sp. 1A13421 TaxID=3368595 RepID=UPI0037465D62